MNLVDNQMQARPWYQHRMMLMVVGIPLLSVVVSFTFLTIAIYTFDGVVVDDYYKQGKEINRVLERDKMAAKLGLEASIAFNNGAVSVVISANEYSDWPNSVTLSILHPTQNGRDMKVELVPASNERTHLDGIAHQQSFRGRYSKFKPGEWILQLETPVWRLTHRTHLTQDSAVKVRP